MSIRNDQGAIALITTVIMGILMAIIVTGMITVMINELRQSDDSEQSTKAYYAAVSGVMDAASKIRLGQLVAGSPAANTCVPLAIDTAAAASVTCQYVSFTGQPSGQLLPSDGAVQYDMTGGAPFNKIKVLWDNVQPASNNDFFKGGIFPPSSEVAAPIAALEAAVITVPSASFKLGNNGFTASNALFVPTTAPEATTPAVSSLSTGNTNINGGCAIANIVTTGYACGASLNFTGGAGVSYLLRLRSLYNGTSFKVEFCENTNCTVQEPDGTATIDVTAKAGSSFRRLVYQIPLGQTANSQLNYVLFSDTNICKNFTVVGGTVNGCGTQNLTPTQQVAAQTVPTPTPTPTPTPKPTVSVDAGGDAGIGNTPAGSIQCLKFHPYPDGTCFYQPVINDSNNDPSTIKGCIWNWGDGQVDTYTGPAEECLYQSWVFHQFTPFPAPPYKQFTATLTMEFYNYPNKTATFLFNSVPWN